VDDYLDPDPQWKQIWIRIRIWEKIWIRKKVYRSKTLVNFAAKLPLQLGQKGPASSDGSATLHALITGQYGSKIARSS